MIEITLMEREIRFPVKVTPRGGRSVVLPYEPGDEWVRVKVKEAPEDGRANAAVIELLARTLGVPKRDVQILRGETFRMKHLAVHHSGGTQFIQTLATALGSTVEESLTIAR